MTVIQAIARRRPTPPTRRCSPSACPSASPASPLPTTCWSRANGRAWRSKISSICSFRICRSRCPRRARRAARAAHAGAAQALGMALHELATNAVKHGALANEAGPIHIRWSIAEGPAEPEFRMDWSEHDGPPVVTPQRTGFGRTVMERMVGARWTGRPRCNSRRPGLSGPSPAPQERHWKTPGARSTGRYSGASRVRPRWRVGRSAACRSSRN